MNETFRYLVMETTKKVKYTHYVKDLTSNQIVLPRSLNVCDLLLFFFGIFPPRRALQSQLIRDPSVIIMQMTAFGTIWFGVNKWQSN